MLKIFGTVALVLGTSSIALAWGAKGHQIIAYTGADLASNGQTFWQANLEPMRQLSTVPDRVWKSNATKAGEAPTHWFQVDAYFSESNMSDVLTFPNSYVDATTEYSESVIVKNGTAPWRIRQLYKMSLDAFKKGNTKAALEYAGTMSHYIGDLSQPLHVTENYDGQLTNDEGIHKYFETTIIGNETEIRADVETRAKKLLKDPAFLKNFNSSLMEVVLLEVERSISFKDQVIKNDLKNGRTAKGAAIQLELAKNRMADGAATLAMILSQLWKDSGLVAHATPMTIEDPEWIKPDFKKLPNFSPTQYFVASEDDCNN
jgi:hypothetical protein